MLLKDPRLKTIVEAKGLDTQCGKLIEEMAELMVAITHMAKKDENCADHYANFIEELGDVAILISQIEVALPKEDKMTLKESISFKINREIERLNGRSLS